MTDTEPRPTFEPSRFGTGFAAALEGLSLLFRSGRRVLLCLVPLFAGLAMLLAAVAMFARSARPFGRWLTEQVGSAGTGTLGKLVVGAVAIALLAAAAYALLIIVITVVAAPIGNVLAAQAEEECGGDPAPTLTLGEEVADAVRGLGHAVLRLGLYLALLAVLGLVAFVIPPFALVAAPLSLAATAVFLAYDLFDPSLSRRRMSFSDKWHFLRVHAIECAGMTMVAMLILSVPIVNVLLAPGLTMGAAVLYVRLTRPRPG